MARIKLYRVEIQRAKDNEWYGLWTCYFSVKSAGPLQMQMQNRMEKTHRITDPRWRDAKYRHWFTQRQYDILSPIIPSVLPEGVRILTCEVDATECYFYDGDQAVLKAREEDYVS